MSRVEPYRIEQGEWHWQLPEAFNIADACIDIDNRPELASQDAFIIENANRHYTTINYETLNLKVRQFASALSAIGVKPTDRLLIRLPNALEYPIVFLGSLYLGAVAVPSSTLLTMEEVAYLANDSEAICIVMADNMLEALPQLLAESPLLKHVVVVSTGVNRASSAGLPAYTGVSLHCLDEIFRECEPLSSPHSTKINDPAYLVYTSGTTGYPKGVLHAHRSLIGRIPASHAWFDFSTEQERILHSGKFNWTYVLGTALMDPLYQGKSVVVFEGDSSPEIWPELIAKHQCTVFIGVPTIYRQILQKTDFGAKDLPSLKHCMSAGEHLSDDMLYQWQARFGLDIFEALGMSECSYYLSHPPGRPTRPGAAGLPQPGHRVALIDERFVPVAQGEEGMIAIPLDDPGLCLEYWRLPDETRKSRQGGYFLTGDYAHADKDGYLWFHGRKDDIINSFGYRISPIEIERVLKSFDLIADCVVVEEVVGQDKTIASAFVIPRGEVDEEAVLAFATAHLASYKVPKKVRFVESFPRTKNGKVLRKGLIRDA